MQLLVSAYDTAVPEMEVSEMVKISILKNIYAPVFNKLSYETTIYDYMAVGAEVIRTNATDRDLTSPENTIIYSLSDNTEYFTINPNNGIVRIASTLTADQTRPPRYTVSVYNGICIGLGQLKKIL